eukprot:4519836-Pleurochrysis_carterae.AAC.1
MHFLIPGFAPLYSVRDLKYQPVCTPTRMRASVIRGSGGGLKAGYANIISMRSRGRKDRAKISGGDRAQARYT